MSVTPPSTSHWRPVFPGTPGDGPGLECTMTLHAALFALRLALAVVFVAHGVKHYRNRIKTIAWTGSIGFRSPRIQWFLMTFAEMGIGLALAAGFVTSVAAAAALAMMVVAYWTVHRHAGFFITARPDEGWEYVFVVAITAAAIAVLGPGEWSIDHVIGWSQRLDGFTGAVIAGCG